MVRRVDRVDAVSIEGERDVGAFVRFGERGVAVHRSAMQVVPYVTGAGAGLLVEAGVWSGEVLDWRDDIVERDRERTGS